MTQKNKSGANQYTGLKRREFLAMLASCTAGLMVPNLFYGEHAGAATAATADRLGQLLPLRKLGASGLKLSELSFGSWVTFNKQVDAGLAERMFGTCFDAEVDIRAHLVVVRFRHQRAHVVAVVGAVADL